MTVSTFFDILKDRRGHETFAAPLSDHIDRVTLSAGVAKEYTIPADTRIILLSGTGDFFVRADGNPDASTGDEVAGAGGALNPTGIAVQDVDGNVLATTLNFLSAGTPTISISCYK